MRNTKVVDHRARSLLSAALASCFALAASQVHATPDTRETSAMQATGTTSATLTRQQQAIVPIAALAAAGDIERLRGALEQGLDAGLTVSDCREVLTQLYAYAGFPRSLNALTALMDVLAEREARGIDDAPGEAPSKPIPKGDALLAAGTANQTRLLGAPATGALFEFAPAADEYLKTHLFGDIFERDNLDWHSREVATVSMLSMLPGAEAQVESHVRISMNIGIAATQLHQLGDVLSQVDADASHRVHQALAKQSSNVASDTDSK